MQPSSSTMAGVERSGTRWDASSSRHRLNPEASLFPVSSASGCRGVIYVRYARRAAVTPDMWHSGMGSSSDQHMSYRSRGGGLKLIAYLRCRLHWPIVIMPWRYEVLDATKTSVLVSEQSALRREIRV